MTDDGLGYSFRPNQRGKALGQGAIFGSANQFALFLTAAFFRHGHGEVRKPAILGSVVPVLHFRRYINHISRLQTARGLVFLLVLLLACGADQNLSGCVVNVPVVAASGFKRYFDRSGVAVGKCTRSLVPMKCCA